MVKNALFRPNIRITIEKGIEVKLLDIFHFTPHL
jgi:hypothetical protein